MKERALLFAAYHSPHMWHLVWSHRGSPAVMQKKAVKKKQSCMRSLCSTPSSRIAGVTCLCQLKLINNQINQHEINQHLSRVYVCCRFFNKKIGYMAQQDESLERVRPSFNEAVAEAAAAGASGKPQPVCGWLVSL